jgi:hypothetical protein
MENYYFTFGQDHVHNVLGLTFNKDTVLCVHCASYSIARELAFRLFDDKWAFQYTEGLNLTYFPQGVICTIRIDTEKSSIVEK